MPDSVPSHLLPSGRNTSDDELGTASPRVFLLAERVVSSYPMLFSKTGQTNEMSDTRETARDLRKKLTRAENSRDSWKGKQAAKQYELKIVKNKLHSALDSRVRWKTASKANEDELARLRKRVDEQDKQLQHYREHTERLSTENEELKNIVSI